MTNFATKNTCSLLGIIDYEIAKKLNKKELYIPIFYATGYITGGAARSLFEQEKLANEIKKNTILYMTQQDNIRTIKETSIKEDVLPNLDSNIPYSSLKAFKITW